MACAEGGKDGGSSDPLDELNIGERISSDGDPTGLGKLKELLGRAGGNLSSAGDKTDQLLKLISDGVEKSREILESAKDNLQAILWFCAAAVVVLGIAYNLGGRENPDQADKLAVLEGEKRVLQAELKQFSEAQAAQKTAVEEAKAAALEHTASLKAAIGGLNEQIFTLEEELDTLKKEKATMPKIPTKPLVSPAVPRAVTRSPPPVKRSALADQEVWLFNQTTGPIFVKFGGETLLLPSGQKFSFPDGELAISASANGRGKTIYPEKKSVVIGGTFFE